MFGNGDLIEKLEKIQSSKQPFKCGLLEAVLYLKKLNGTAVCYFEDDTVFYKLSLNGESAIAFQPYDDIDAFYYEH